MILLFQYFSLVDSSAKCACDFFLFFIFIFFNPPTVFTATSIWVINTKGPNNLYYTLLQSTAPSFGISKINFVKAYLREQWLVWGVHSVWRKSAHRLWPHSIVARPSGAMKTNTLVVEWGYPNCLTNFGCLNVMQGFPVVLSSDLESPYARAADHPCN